MDNPGRPQRNQTNPPRRQPTQPPQRHDQAPRGPDQPPQEGPDQPPQEGTDQPRPQEGPDQAPQEGPDQPLQRPPQTPPRRKVFLNFRGDELPIKFMELLMMQLGKEKISIFIERDELRGRELQHHFSRIEESDVALAIFSKSYAESEWCLEELVKMKERMIQSKLVVIPVFYKVKKKDVLIQAGEFGNHFTVTKQRYENDQEKIHRWEESLTLIAGNGHIHFGENGNHSKLVAGIIRTVKLKLKMPRYWPSQYVFFTTLAVCIVMTNLRPPLVKFSAEWLFGFPVFVAMVWQIVCHG